MTNLLFLAKMDEQSAGNTRSLLEVADRELQRLSHIAARSLKFYRQRTAPALTSLEELIESVLFFNEPELQACAASSWSGAIASADRCCACRARSSR